MDYAIIGAVIILIIIIIVVIYFTVLAPKTTTNNTANNTTNNTANNTNNTANNTANNTNNVQQTISSTVPGDSVVVASTGGQLYYINSDSQRKYALSQTAVTFLGNPKPVVVNTTALSNIPDYMSSPTGSGGGILPKGIYNNTYVSDSAGDKYWIYNFTKYKLNASQYSSLGSPSTTSITYPSELAVIPSSSTAPIMPNSYVSCSNGRIYYINSTVTLKYYLDPSNYTAAGNPTPTPVDCSSGSQFSNLKESMNKGTPNIPTAVNNNAVVEVGSTYYELHNGELYPYPNNTPNAALTATNYSLSSNVAKLLPIGGTPIIPRTFVSCNTTGRIYYISKNMQKYWLSPAEYAAAGNPPATIVSCYELSLIPEMNTTSTGTIAAFPHGYGLASGSSINVNGNYYTLGVNSSNQGYKTALKTTPSNAISLGANVAALIPTIVVNNAATTLPVTSNVYINLETQLYYQTGFMNGQIVNCPETYAYYLIVLTNGAYNTITLINSSNSDIYWTALGRPTALVLPE